MIEHFDKVGISDKQLNYIANANSRWNISSGAVRSGKTYGSFFILPVRMRQQPEGNRLLIGKTERTLKRNVLDPLRIFYGKKYVSDVYGDGNVNIFGKQCYIVGANDERAVSKIQGMGLVYAYGDEITTWPESFFQMLKSRLSGFGAKFDGTCNSESPYHWLLKFLNEDDVLDIKHFTYTIDDNPFLDPVFVRELKKEYTGVWYDRYIEGKWVLAEGVVYSMFDHDLHVINELPFNLSPNMHYYVSVDYGTTNPTAFGLYVIYNGIVYKIKEYFFDSQKERYQKTDTDYSEDLSDFIGDLIPKRIFVDPSALSFITQLKRDGFRNIYSPNNDVINGIRTQARMLSTNRYKILSNCPETIREYSQYVWDAKSQINGIDKPVKAFDHTKDEERYLLHTMFGTESGITPFNKRRLGL